MKCHTFDDSTLCNTVSRRGGVVNTLSAHFCVAREKYAIDADVIDMPQRHYYVAVVCPLGRTEYCGVLLLFCPCDCRSALFLDDRIGAKIQLHLVFSLKYYNNLTKHSFI